MAENANDSEKKIVVPRPVGIDFKVPDSVSTLYASEVAVQVILTDFVLSFFEVRIPILQPGFDSETTMLDAQCVGRIAISSEKIPDLIRTLESQYRRFAGQTAIPIDEDSEHEVGSA